MPTPLPPTFDFTYALLGHRMDKPGRSGAGWRSVGGRSAVGERRSEVGRRLGGGWSEVDRAPVGGRSGDHSMLVQI